MSRRTMVIIVPVSVAVPMKRTIWFVIRWMTIRLGIVIKGVKIDEITPFRARKPTR